MCRHTRHPFIKHTSCQKIFTYVNYDNYLNKRELTLIYVCPSKMLYVNSRVYICETAAKHRTNARHIKDIIDRENVEVYSTSDFQSLGEFSYIIREILN